MINNLSNINLNLLVVFDALLAEQNTTKAADKLNSTQPTVSKALGQLRNIFEDELLVRGQAGHMFLTPRAKSLKTTVKETIEKLKTIFIEEEIFDPKKAKLTFNIGMSDYTSLLLLPKLIRIINQKAPNIKFRVWHLKEMQALNELDEDQLDIAIYYEKYLPQKLANQVLFTDNSVCVADKSHPAIQKKHLTIEDFTKYPHLFATNRKKISDNTTQKALKKINQKRIISGIVPHMIVALNLLRGTDYLCVIPSKLAYKFADSFDLAISPLPFAKPHVTMYQAWKREDENNPPNQWLRSTIKKIAQNI